MTDTTTAVKKERGATAPRSLGAGGLTVKVILIGIIDALLILSIAKSVDASWWLATAFFAGLFVAVNFVYFTQRALPFKYLLPGLALLVVFQLYTMIYTGYASFTNYGSGHLSDKQSSIASIQQQSVVPIKGAAAYAVVPLLKGSTVSMLITDPDSGQVSVGSNDGLDEVSDGIQKDGDKVTGLDGYQSLNLGTLTSNKAYDTQWTNLKVPLDKDKGIFLRAVSVTSATQAKSAYTYDKGKDAIVSSVDGSVYRADNNTGSFTADNGKTLKPGWKVTVGFKNYVSLVTDSTLRSRFLPILIWTFVFSILTTFLNFALGLLMAMVLNDRRMRGQGIYRLLLIVPYGLPGILSILVWKAMLNSDFGLINQFLGADIGWLTHANLARFSVLMVNLWMGFPYFFLVCSGALTAIPNDMKEAAYVDGASGRYAFRTVILPLLLVATAPLLVTTFAFNFNNYPLIQLLTSGGPFPGGLTDGGDTDLLINYTFRLAFNSSQQQLGLASAIAMVIFLVVGTVSAYGFRLTKRLEEI